MRAITRRKFALFPQDGRWYLGRKDGAATAYEIVAGPMKAPSDSGFIVTYFDSIDAVTTDPTAVERIEVLIRSESAGAAPGVGTYSDSMTTVVFLKNNGN